MSWVGIPYIDGGRTKDGCDCWGLLRLFMKEEAGIDLPEHTDVSASHILAISKRMDAAVSTDVWNEVSQYHRFDCVVMSHPHRDVRFHCGVMIDRSRMLHIYETTDSVIMRTDHPLIRGRMLGVYRHKDLL